MSISKENLLLMRPRTKEVFRVWLKEMLGLQFPDRTVCPHHQAPLDFVWDAYSGTPKDKVILGPRGGGKTLISGVLSGLNAVHLPGCGVRILGGSLDQSKKGYDYFSSLIEGNFFWLVNGEIQTRLTKFKNGSAVEILPQSQKSVRGPHIPKLRCDEIDEFDPKVLAAAKAMPMSQRGIPASMEMYSTRHRPYGPMQSILEEAAKAGYQVYTWCIFEVLETCRDYSCSRCLLSEDCQGKAKNANGYYLIEDAIKTRRRVSDDMWIAELLCERASVAGLVYRGFRDQPPWVVKINHDPKLETQGAVDWGYEHPFVFGLLQKDTTGQVRLFKELVLEHKDHEECAKVVKPLVDEYKVSSVWCDPSEPSGIAAFKKAGIPARKADNSVAKGIEAIRSRLKLDENGRPKLIIDGSCALTRREFTLYALKEGEEMPIKQNDHALDMLRYAILGLLRGKIQGKIV